MEWLMCPYCKHMVKECPCPICETDFSEHITTNNNTIADTEDISLNGRPKWEE